MERFGFTIRSGQRFRKSMGGSQNKFFPADLAEVVRHDPLEIQNIGIKKLGSSLQTMTTLYQNEKSEKKSLPTESGISLQKKPARQP